MPLIVSHRYRVFPPPLVLAGPVVHVHSETGVQRARFQQVAILMLPCPCALLLVG